MAFSARENYQATEVRTATPQKLQLMLIDGALVAANRARNAWNEPNADEALRWLMRGQKIVAEMMGATNRDLGGELVKKVLSIYEFVYRRLVDAGYRHNETALLDAIRVLEVERETWRQLCEKLATSEPKTTEWEQTEVNERVPSPHFGLPAQYDEVALGGFSIEA